MGCDIHGFVEKRLNGGGAEIWAATLNLDYLMRDYELFSALFGVKFPPGNPPPIAKGRGLPDNMDAMTRREYEFDTEHYPPHSETWAYWGEMIPVITKHRAYPNWPEQDFYGEWEAAFKFCEALIENGQHETLSPTDVRWVVWFDN